MDRQPPLLGTASRRALLAAATGGAFTVASGIATPSAQAAAVLPAALITRGIDYSWGRPRPSAISAAGYTFACRYLSWDNTGKNLTADEVQALAAAGVDVVANWEYSASEALGGYSAGVSNAQEAQRQALACGMPADRPIYFSVDFDAGAGQQATINAYFDGVASVLGRGRTGAYGGFYVIQRLFDAGKIAWGWQTYAWSGGQWDSRAQLRQILNGIKVDGADCDLDEAWAPDFGQWRRRSSTDVNARVVYRTADGHIRMMSVGTSAWRNDDLTAIAAGPPATGNPYGYATNLPPYGPVARVLYRTADGHIHDLAASASFGWNDHDLTALTGAPPSVVDPMGYVSNLAGQGPVARVVYRSGNGHIQMMSLGGSGWVNHDLTAIAGAPNAIGSPFGYSTNMPPYGEVARVVYRTGDGHIHDLAVGSSFPWNDHDLTAITGGPPAMDNLYAYTTNLPGQGPAARVLYRTADGHIHETAIGASFGWNDHDLTAITAAPVTVVNPMGFSSNLDGQGQVARVVYKDGNGHIQMMSVGGSGWVNHDLTAITGTQSALGSPYGYSTNLSDYGNVARVVYRTNDGHIHDLAVGSSFPWNDHDLTVITGAPSTAVNPFGYTTGV